jgi:3-oxoacyl-[acyl-carrier-protein] synthase I
MMKPVYIAGNNIITSLGFTTEEVMKNVESGTIGFKKYDDRSLTPSPVPLSLIDRDKLNDKFRSLLLIHHPDKTEDQFTRLEKMFIVSIDEAVKDINTDIYGSNSLLLISSTKGNIDLLDETNQSFPDQTRLLLWKMADEIGAFFGFVNRPQVISNACISGVLALSTASRMIEAGIYEHIVVAGGDLLSEFVISGFLSFQALSSEPCKPFDSSRNGLSLGEGCGTLILSSTLKSPNLITVSGSSVTNDANHISGPSRTGEELAMAITNSLRESDIVAADIDFVSAHGTATLYNDEMESKALDIAGLVKTPVNSFKGYWGHTLGGAGIIESVATIHSMENNLLYRSAGYNESGVPFPLNVITENTPSQVNNCLKIASGFGGCNAAIIFCKR